MHININLPVWKQQNIENRVMLTWYIMAPLFGSPELFTKHFAMRILANTSNIIQFRIIIIGWFIIFPTFSIITKLIFYIGTLLLNLFTVFVSFFLESYFFVKIISNRKSSLGLWTYDALAVPVTLWGYEPANKYYREKNCPLHIQSVEVVKHTNFFPCCEAPYAYHQYNVTYANLWMTLNFYAIERDIGFSLLATLK